MKGVGNMRKEYIYSILDGIITGLLLCFIGEYTFSTLFIEPQIEYNLIIIFIICIISLVSTYFLIFRKAECSILKKYLISIASFMVVLIVDVINLVTFKIRLLPIRETSDADGLLAIFFMGIYLAFVLISHLLALIIDYIIKKRKL